MSQLFEELKQLKKPAILFLDEADSLLGNRETSKTDETSIKVKSILLERLEELNNSSLDVIVLCASNRWDMYWSLSIKIKLCKIFHEKKFVK